MGAISIKTPHKCAQSNKNTWCIFRAKGVCVRARVKVRVLKWVTSVRPQSVWVRACACVKNMRVRLLPPFGALPRCARTRSHSRFWLPPHSKSVRGFAYVCVCTMCVRLLQLFEVRGAAKMCTHAVTFACHYLHMKCSCMCVCYCAHVFILCVRLLPPFGALPRCARTRSHSRLTSSTRSRKNNGSDARSREYGL